MKLQTVNADDNIDVVGRFLKYLNNLSKLLISGLEKLCKNSGIEITDVKDSTDPKYKDLGAKILYGKLADNTEFQVALIPHEDDAESCDILVDGLQGKIIGRENIHYVKDQDYDDVIDAIQSAIEELFNVDSIEELLDRATDEDLLDTNAQLHAQNNTSSARTLQCTFRKICANDETIVELTSVMSNYSPEASLQDIQTLLDTDSFISQLSTNTPSSFLVTTTDDDDLSVEECDECAEDITNNACEVILGVMYATLHQLQFAHWNAIGLTNDTEHQKTSELIYKIFDMLDEFAEIAVELSATGSIQHPSYFISKYVELDEIAVADPHSVSISDTLQKLITTIDLYYCDFGSDIQSVLDEWQRTLKKYSRFVFREHA